MSEFNLEEILAAQADKGDIIMCEGVAIPRGEKPPTEMRVAPAGRFEGHPNGPFTIDAEFATTVERNRQALSFRPPIDERHRTNIPYLAAPRFGSVGSYEFRDDGLYACEMEWNERGTKSYKADEYGYVSIGFKPDVKHPKTGLPMGPLMTHLAQTNVPFFGGAATVLNEQGTKEPQMDVKKIIVELNNDPTAMAELKKGLGLDQIKPISAEAPLVPESIPAIVCEEFGLAADATVDDLEVAMAARKESQAQSIVASAVAAGKVPKDPESELHKTTLVMAQANPEQTEQFLASLPGSVPGAADKPPAERETAEDTDGDEPAELTDDQKAINAELGLDDDDWKKYGAAGE